MVQNLKNNKTKYIVSGLIFLIISSFFFLNQNFYKQNKKDKSYVEFKIEAKNIHSLIKDKLQNQYNKEKISIKKGQNLNTILTNAGASQKEIFNISKILRQYISLKKLNTDQVFEILTDKKSGEIIRLTVNLDNINSLHIFKKDK